VLGLSDKSSKVHHQIVTSNVVTSSLDSYEILFLTSDAHQNGHIGDFAQHMRLLCRRVAYSICDVPSKTLQSVADQPVLNLLLLFLVNPEAHSHFHQNSLPDPTRTIWVQSISYNLFH
jgi:hypothetical protein